MKNRMPIANMLSSSAGLRTCSGEEGTGIPRPRVKVALYGGLANIIYVFAKLAARRGWDVCFIRDRNDRYAFSQPVWEDTPCALPYDKVSQSAAWSWAQWSEWEAAQGWKAPPWMADPLALPFCRASVRHVPGLIDRAYLAAWGRLMPHWGAVQRAMNACDVIIAGGVEGTLLASTLDKPYLLMPCGADLRLAVGFWPTASWNPVKLLWRRALGRVLFKGFTRAWCLGSHDPTLGGGRIGSRKVVPAERLTAAGATIPRLPYAFVGRDRLPRDSRRDLLAELMGASACRHRGRSGSSWCRRAWISIGRAKSGSSGAADCREVTAST